MSQWIAEGQGLVVEIVAKDVMWNMANSEQTGGGWSDFTDWLKDTGRKVVSIASKYVLPILGAALEVLPSTHPYVIALKGVVKATTVAANALDRAINEKDYREAVSEEASLDADKAEADYDDAKDEVKASSKNKSISKAMKEEIAKRAAALKARLEAKRSAKKKADAAAAAASKKAADLKRAKDDAVKKQRAAEERVVQAAKDAKTKKKK
jgi:hypothetical protein